VLLNLQIINEERILTPAQEKVERDNKWKSMAQ